MEFWFVAALSFKRSHEGLESLISGFYVLYYSCAFYLLSGDIRVEGIKVIRIAQMDNDIWPFVSGESPYPGMVLDRYTGLYLGVRYD